MDESGLGTLLRIFDVINWLMSSEELEFWRRDIKNFISSCKEEVEVHEFPGRCRVEGDFSTFKGEMVKNRQNIT